MTWELKLDELDHDLRIENGEFLRVRGSDEVRQRIKVSLWHYLGEYFLNTNNGVPWYEQILGRKSDADLVSAILRREILKVPRVIRIESLKAIFLNGIRQYQMESEVQVEAGPGEPRTIANINMPLSSEPEDVI